VRSYTDTYAVTSIADSPSALWVGTPHGLLRWDVATGKYALLGAEQGLPTDRITALALDGQRTVWAAMPRQVVHSTRSGWQLFPPPPVGDFITGMVASSDGKILWAGGPE